MAKANDALKDLISLIEIIRNSLHLVRKTDANLKTLYNIIVTIFENSSELNSQDVYELNLQYKKFDVLASIINQRLDPHTHTKSIQIQNCKVQKVQEVQNSADNSIILVESPCTISQIEPLIDREFFDSINLSIKKINECYCSNVYSHLHTITQ